MADTKANSSKKTSPGATPAAAAADAPPKKAAPKSPPKAATRAAGSGKASTSPAKAAPSAAKKNSAAKTPATDKNDTPAAAKKSPSRAPRAAKKDTGESAQPATKQAATTSQIDPAQETNAATASRAATGKKASAPRKTAKSAAKNTAAPHTAAGSETPSPESAAPTTPANDSAAKSASASTGRKKTPAAKSTRAASAKSTDDAARATVAEGESSAASTRAAAPKAKRNAPAARNAKPSLPEAAPSRGEQKADTGQPAQGEGENRPTAPQDSEKSASGERPRSGGRQQSKRASTSGKRSAASREKREEAGAAAATEPAPFEEHFDSFAPENAVASPEAAATAEADAETSGDGEKKKRQRSRRGGRGRKRNTAANAPDMTDTNADATQSATDDEADEAAENLAQTRPGDSEDTEAASAEGGKKNRKEDKAAPAKSGRRKMFVSVLPEEQVEVVITEEGQVLEYYVEMLHQAKTKGNIYKGVIHNVDPNLQAAFVSYGAVKNGFLQIDEVHPEYYVMPHEAGKGRKYPPIQKVLKAGQEVLVQVVKEPAGTKGAFLTTYLSLPGRFLVLTPGREQIGVSRKVDNDAERARLRELLKDLQPGAGLGVIVRTVSMGASEENLQQDLEQLKRVWGDVRSRGTSEKAPCLVYQEKDLTARAVRDYLTESIGEVWIDDDSTAASVAEIAEELFPRKKNLVKTHSDASMTLFERFNVQRQLDQIHSREVVLPSGGRLVIDPTEALTAIDINSGRSGGKNNFEDMAYRTNMEAAKMIPLQLRLRDIGGQVVADFIEMRDKSHWREVEKTLRNGMKVDRARYDVGKIGPFGLLEIVRQRLGSSAISVSTEPCPHCGGTGVRRNMEWRSQHAMRDILRQLRQAQAQSETVTTYATDQSLALHLLNAKRQRLLEMEQRFGVRVDIVIKAQEHM